MVDGCVVADASVVGCVHDVASTDSETLWTGGSDVICVTCVSFGCVGSLTTVRIVYVSFEDCVCRSVVGTSDHSLKLAVFDWSHVMAVCRMGGGVVYDAEFDVDLLECFEVKDSLLSDVTVVTCPSGDDVLSHCCSSVIPIVEYVDDVICTCVVTVVGCCVEVCEVIYVSKGSVVISGTVLSVWAIVLTESSSCVGSVALDVASDVSCECSIDVSVVVGVRPE